MITILSVLRSGGIYDHSWVLKLKRAVARNLTEEHRFECLTDVDCSVTTLKLKHNWPGWYSKIEAFRPGVISGPTLYLDLDTVITGPMDEFTNLPYDFAMLRNFNDDAAVGSGMMWFKDKAPEGVYEKFCEDPKRVMDYYDANCRGVYIGDQAFIADCLGDGIDRIESPALRSYKRHCRNGLPDGTSIVCFHGRPRPSEIGDDWLLRNWI